MKQIIIASASAAIISILAAGCSSSCDEKCAPQPAPTTVNYNLNEIVGTDELARMIKEKPRTYTLLDARSERYFDGRIIPTAKRLSSDSGEKEITAALPNKNAFIITYCGGIKCPASKILADKLRKMGYTNIKEYPDGMDAWRKSGKSTEKSR